MVLTRDMQDAAVMSDFQQLGPAPPTKRGCAAYLVAVAIGALLGAAANEAARQVRPGLVPFHSLQNVSRANSSLRVNSSAPLGGEMFSGYGPAQKVLISHSGVQPQEGQLLTTVETAETFEVSFDITPHASAPPTSPASIVHFGNPDTQRLPGFWLGAGSTGLLARMDRRQGVGYGHQVGCDTDALPVGQATHVVLRLVDDAFTLWFNGQLKCDVGGFFENRVPAQPTVDVWFSDPWYPAADVTVANLVYTPLYACGPIR